MFATCPEELLIDRQDRIGGLQAMVLEGDLPLGLIGPFLVCVIYCLTEHSSGHVTQRDGHGELSTCVLTLALESKC